MAEPFKCLIWFRAIKQWCQSLISNVHIMAVWPVYSFPIQNILLLTYYGGTIEEILWKVPTQIDIRHLVVVKRQKAPLLYKIGGRFFILQHLHPSYLPRNITVSGGSCCLAQPEVFDHLQQFFLTTVTFSLLMRGICEALLSSTWDVSSCKSVLR